MAEVSFYYVQKPPIDRVLIKILEKAYAQNERAVVLSSDQDRIKVLNTTLWTYSPGSFLPHSTLEDAQTLAIEKQDFYKSEQPIWLTPVLENPNTATLLILLDQTGPKPLDSIPSDSKTSAQITLGSFKRIVLLIDAQDSNDLEYAAKWHKIYQTEGHKITQWQQSAEGAWNAM